MVSGSGFVWRAEPSAKRQQRHGLQKAFHGCTLVEKRLVFPQRDLVLEQPIR
jgi:hypothetical protein